MQECERCAILFKRFCSKYCVFLRNSHNKSGLDIIRMLMQDRSELTTLEMKGLEEHVITSCIADGNHQFLIFATEYGYVPSEAILSEAEASLPDAHAWWLEYRRQPLSLKHQCRLVVRHLLRKRIFLAVRKLELPRELQQYLLL